MTKDQLIKRLKLLARKNIDEDSAHRIADRLLLKYINDPKVMEAFNQIEKWYA